MNARRLATRTLVRATATTAVALTGALAALASGATAAGAATLDPATASAGIEQGLPGTLTVAGTADSGASSTLYVVARQTGGPACGQTYQDDQGAAGSVSQVLTGADGTTVSQGSFSVPLPWKPAFAGSVTVCAWLAQSGGSGAGPQTTAVTVAAPRASLSVTAPASLTAGTAFQIQYTTTTDQTITLVSLARTAAGGPCAASYAADRQAHSSQRILGGTTLDTGSVVTTGSAKLSAGSYLICSWLQYPQSNEVVAAASTAVTVAAAPTPPTTPIPSAAVTLATPIASAAGIAFSGTTTAALTGGLAVVEKCQKQAVKATVPASGGHYSGSLPLPAGCAPGARVTLTIRWPGSATFAASTAQSTVVVAGASTTTTKKGGETKAQRHRQRELARRRTLLVAVHRTRRTVTNIFQVRPLMMVISPQLTLHRFRWFAWSVREGRGRATVYTSRTEHYHMLVTASHDIHGMFTCLSLTHSVKRDKRRVDVTERFGLGRAGREVVWVPLARLHRRGARVKPWPEDSCPAPRRR